MPLVGGVGPRGIRQPGYFLGRRICISLVESVAEDVEDIAPEASRRPHALSSTDFNAG